MRTRGWSGRWKWGMAIIKNMLPLPMDTGNMDTLSSEQNIPFPYLYWAVFCHLCFSASPVLPQLAEKSGRWTISQHVLQPVQRHHTGTVSAAGSTSPCSHSGGLREHWARSASSSQDKDSFPGSETDGINPQTNFPGRKQQSSTRLCWLRHFDSTCSRGQRRNSSLGIPSWTRALCNSHQNTNTSIGSNQKEMHLNTKSQFRHTAVPCFL